MCDFRKHPRETIWSEFRAQVRSVREGRVFLKGIFCCKPRSGPGQSDARFSFIREGWRREYRKHEPAGVIGRWDLKWFPVPT